MQVLVKVSITPMYGLVGFLGCFFIVPGGSVCAQSNEDARRIDLFRKHMLSTTNVYAAPKLISSRNAQTREVSVTLNVQLAEVTIARPQERDRALVVETQKLLVRTYNGSMTVPAIRALPGDVLKIKLINSIPKNTPDKPADKNKPNGFNITNLHTHGLHVSPEGRSDNVYLEIGPGESTELTIAIPPDHPAGIFWIHAHRHGSTALQLCSGMAGALIIDPGNNGGLDQVPEIAEAMKNSREKVMVFQQLLYSLRPDGIGEVTEQDVYGGTPQHRVTLINGQYAPLMEFKPGEVQRWRCVHAGIDSTLNLAIGDDPDQGRSDLKNLWDLHEIAVDGLPLNRMTCSKSVNLQPGYRSDFLVQAPLQEGNYILTSTSLPRGKSLRRMAQLPVALAHVRVKGTPIPMHLPNPSVTAKYALTPIDESELYNRLPYRLTFKADGTVFTINGQEFDRDRIDLCPRLGTAEEWELKSEVDQHPFHIHVNPFEVVQKDTQGKVISRVWRDTIFFTEDDTGPTIIRSRFRDFPGKTVLHCHNLSHEDQGMMMAIRFVGTSTKGLPPVKKEQSGLGTLPAKAPPWTLHRADAREHTSADLLGQPQLLVFYRGLTCVHCRRQLKLLAEHRIELNATGVRVIAISPDAEAEIKKTLTDKNVPESKAFLLLSDPSLQAFKAFGCFDGAILHGLFLVNRDGIVLWQRVGDEPFMDIDVLLNRCRGVSHLEPRGAAASHGCSAR
jgi:FtsP/CotA-like multicopper oxidase with cupredoxin domain/peroxiredoxin